jgi:hypothetical protein
MEATCSCEMSVDFQRTTLLYIPEYRSLLFNITLISTTSYAQWPVLFKILDINLCTFLVSLKCVTCATHLILTWIGNNFRWRVKFTVPVFLYSCNFISLGSKYSPQHPFLKYFRRILHKKGFSKNWLKLTQGLNKPTIFNSHQLKFWGLVYSTCSAAFNGMKNFGLRLCTSNVMQHSFIYCLRADGVSSVTFHQTLTNSTDY